MASLFLLSKSLDADGTASLQAVLGTGDHIVLVSDAVILPRLPHASLLLAICAAMRVDVDARGLLASWPPAIPLIDHEELVRWCVSHDRVISWS